MFVGFSVRPGLWLLLPFLPGFALGAFTALYFVGHPPAPTCASDRRAELKDQISFWEGKAAAIDQCKVLASMGTQLPASCKGNLDQEARTATANACRAWSGLVALGWPALPPYCRTSIQGP